MAPAEIPRLMLFDVRGASLGDVSPSEVTGLESKEEIGGEHSLTLSMTRRLDKGTRVVVRDGMGLWHEYVVTGAEASRGDGEQVVTEHYCVWSLQYDLSLTYVDDEYGCGVVPGHTSVPQDVMVGLRIALGGTSRWEVGDVDVTSRAAASFYRRSGWEALKTVTEKWGGELQATISVGQSGVTSRRVDLLRHVGRAEAARRFDYGGDVSGIKRTVSDDPLPCRIVPLGKSVQTDNGGYSRRPGIKDVNGGVEWVQDDEAAAALRVPDGAGGWEYPTAIVKNDTYEDPSELLTWAREHVRDYTTPQVTYEADVMQLSRAGMDAHGVALGDEVVVVDEGFCEGGLRISARVVGVSEDLLDPAGTRLTIGNAKQTLGSELSSVGSQVSELSDQVASSMAYRSTREYMEALVAGINGEVNATGGYTYIVPGMGLRTYDRAVSDPAVGAEATSVIELRGGSVRIADSRTSTGDWDWRTFGTGAGFVADCIITGSLRAGLIKTGVLTDRAGRNYWDFDTGAISWTGYATDADLSDATAGLISSVDVLYAQSDGPEAPSGEWSTNPPAWVDGRHIWAKTRTTRGGVETETEPVDITGATGRTGADGTSVTVSRVEYAQGASSSASPASGWQDSVPDVPQGAWLWCRTVYSDGSAAYTCSHMGTDGRDGRSVAVQSVTKAGGVTTVVLADTDGKTSTLTIDDGADGRDGIPGQPGADGRSSYTHIAWAASPDGSSGFSTTESAGKSYIGVYEDSAQADSPEPRDYSWSRIRGEDGRSPTATVTKSGDTATVTIRNADGTTSTATVRDGTDGTDGTSGYVHLKYSDDGGRTLTANGGEEPGAWLGLYTDSSEPDSADPAAYAWYEIKGEPGQSGRGVASIVEQYYLSDSDAAQTGGSWSTVQPSWTRGHYVWTRSHVTWTDGTITDTAPELAKAINSANESAADAEDDAAAAKGDAATAKGEAEAARSEADAAKTEADAASAGLAELKTQEAIFNLLTNNGALKGLYMKDGQLYVNATYVSSGTLNVVDADGNTIVRIGDDAKTGIELANPFDRGAALMPLSDIVYASPVAVTSDELFGSQEPHVDYKISDGSRNVTGDNFYSDTTQSSNDVKVMTGKTGKVALIVTYRGESRCNGNGTRARSSSAAKFSGRATVRVYLLVNPRPSTSQMFTAEDSFMGAENGCQSAFSRTSGSGGTWSGSTYRFVGGTRMDERSFSGRSMPSDVGYNWNDCFSYVFDGKSPFSEETIRIGIAFTIGQDVSGISSPTASSDYANTYVHMFGFSVIAVPF